VYYNISLTAAVPNDNVEEVFAEEYDEPNAATTDAADNGHDGMPTESANSMEEDNEVEEEEK
jgi:hypothetical protein